MPYKPILISSAWGLLIAAATWAGTEIPVAMSPGSATGTLIGDACPTFSWGAVSGAESYELVVVQVQEGSEEAQPVLRQALRGAALGWTPSLDRCLERGGRYAWSVRAVGESGARGLWSEAALFQVAAGTSERELQEALAVVRGYLASGAGAVSSAQAPKRGGATPEPSSRPRASPTEGRDAMTRLASRVFIPDGTLALSLNQGDTPVLRLEQDDSQYPPSIWDLAANETGFVIRDITNSHALPFTIQAGAPSGSLSIDSSGLVQGSFAGNITGTAGGVSCDGCIDSQQINDGSLELADLPSGCATGEVLRRTVGGWECATVAGNEPASLFGSFGGDGTADRTVSGTQNLDTTVAEYQNLTIPAGATLVANKGFALIGVSGTCDIAGTIDAAGKGRAGGPSVTGNSLLGSPGHRAAPVEIGYGMSGSLSAAAVTFAVSGSGGGGGGAQAPAGGGVATALLARGGDGGGASGRGGLGGCVGCAARGLHGDTTTYELSEIFLATGGAAPGSGLTRTDSFAPLLHHPGAGGGSGAVGSAGGTGGAGGAGGGVVYLECGSLNFSGSIMANGSPGGSASGDAGGGGGGGGGVVLLRARAVTWSGTWNVDPGSGGSGSGTGGNGGAGLLGYADRVEFP